MTEEEVARFALQLKEAERIRAMMAEEKEGTLANGGDDEPSGAAASKGERSSMPAMIAAAP